MRTFSVESYAVQLFIETSPSEKVDPEGKSRATDGEGSHVSVISIATGQVGAGAVESSTNTLRL